MSKNDLTARATFCYGCGKKVVGLDERVRRSCNLCNNRNRESWIVLNDTIRSIENLMSRASVETARKREDGK